MSKGPAIAVARTRVTVAIRRGTLITTTFRTG